MHSSFNQSSKLLYFLYSLCDLMNIFLVLFLGLPSGKQTQLLSKKMSNEIKIHDIVCVVQESDSPPRTQTLPSSTSSSNPHPTSSSTTSSESFFVERGKRGDRSAESLGVEVCSLPSCNIQTCLWHKFVLGFPQYVIWDPFTKTFELNKNGSTSFGFKFKVKKHVSYILHIVLTFHFILMICSLDVLWKVDWMRGMLFITAEGLSICSIYD